VTRSRSVGRAGSPRSVPAEVGRLPDGFAVRLDPRTRRLARADGGTALLGLSSGRLLYLAPAAECLLGGDELAVRDGLGARLARRLLDAGIAHPVVVAEPGQHATLPGGPAEEEVSVVVPVRDRPDGLRELLAALADTTPSLAEVLVVDDGSTDPDTHLAVIQEYADLPGTSPSASAPGVSPFAPVSGTSPSASGSSPPARPALSGEPIDRKGWSCGNRGRSRGSGEASGPTSALVGRVRLIRHPRARGPAAARNTGMAAATTPFVAFLDSDVVPEPGWLAPLRAHLADPAVALAAPQVVALPTKAGPGSWLDRYEALRSSLDLGPDPARIAPLTRVAYVPSAALLVRRAALGTGFAEELRVAEDVDLVLRLHAAGWRLRYEPAARVAHRHRARPLSWWIRKAFYGTGAAPLALRHPGAVPPLALAPWAAAVCLLVVCWRRGTLLGAAVVTAGAGWRLRRRLPELRRPGVVAARLVGLGLVGAANQAAGLLLRHWWPLAVPASLVSRRTRAVVLATALAEGLVDWYRHRPANLGLPGQTGLDPVRYLLAHRLDDLGYGAGLWWGAARHHTLAPLRPVLVRSRRLSSGRSA
jgi:mycofactocin system glycosyltransferase